ncbi:MAG: hypothetical protein ABIK83_06515 [Candidatus Zixiibacteriota bacterium]
MKGPVEKVTDRGTSSSRGAKRRGDLYVNQDHCETWGLPRFALRDDVDWPYMDFCN